MHRRPVCLGVSMAGIPPSPRGGARRRPAQECQPQQVAIAARTSGSGDLPAWQCPHGCGSAVRLGAAGGPAADCRLFGIDAATSTGIRTRLLGVGRTPVDGTQLAGWIETRAQTSRASPLTCSAKVVLGQAGAWHEKRRTVRQITTSRPPAAVSNSRRSYRPCTRRNTVPHPGQAADEPHALAWTRTDLPAEKTASTSTSARCGSRTSATSRSHGQHDHKSYDHDSGRHAGQRHRNCARASIHVPPTDRSSKPG